MRGETLYKILDFLEDQSLSTLDFFQSFLSAGYGASMNKIDYEYKKLNRQRANYKIERDKRRHLQKYISKLKKDGLIIENPGKEISISSFGKERLELFKKNKMLDKKIYKKEKGNHVIIVSYDIPVLFNRERDKIREILKILGFSMVHKSVWVGKMKLPKKFILALEKLEILQYFEILEVTKSGSLRQI
ncbi:hypothetical protein A3C67_02105 [Candidatus Nomurabacteria bacterium RIFCSPHIGHO2_02_FULL_42_19]|uniref:Transcriptional repressor PaaX-like central Cas2-like domain-containing protein n=1 Tax=Candidatus Nomurabacteria bacterium RIFCSPHIGHO2_02_FULL_42_19 TaxID=1801756 RepID=A0A1F6W1X5_9BACT|nr:MAG: hypothetical protein A3C67_02105 [Candidatus Nomurabacteria bacterium RIFCSPHIGHO2_02_FULL_42_19]